MKKGPVNFGVEKLESAVHRNVAIKLHGGQLIGANSVILAFNSPVLDDVITNQRRSIIEMDRLTDHSLSYDTVYGFTQVLYHGEVNLDEENFRDINFLATVLQVEWIKDRCRDFFTMRVNKAKDFDSLNNLVNEALFLKQAADNCILIDILTRKMQEMNPDDVDDFLRSFLANWSFSSAEQLKFAIKISEEGQISNLLKIVKEKIEMSGVFDETSRYILQNVNVSKCLRENAQLYNQIFDLLVDAGLDSTNCYSSQSGTARKIFRYIFRPCTN
ncbi:hypothetical protein ACHWQZ_G002823 [Mnemiopsis leidyi]